MRLTTFTDYSLRMLIFVATAPGERATIAEVAAAFGISESHLVKAAHLLGKSGVLATTRGRGGGLRLARPAPAIRIGAVVRATEGGDLLAECFDRASNRCVLTKACRLARVLGEALSAYYAVLDRYTLADLVENRAKVVAILHPPRRALRASRAG